MYHWSNVTNDLEDSWQQVNPGPVLALVMLAHGGRGG